MKVFILVGMQLSGKSSHGHTLREEKGIPMIETGHAVYHEIIHQGLEVNHVNTTKIIKELLSKDPTAFAQAILEYEYENYKDSSILLFNGIKSPAEIDFARKRFGINNVKVLGFHASQNTRFSRVKNPDRFQVSGRYLEKTQEDQDLANWDNFISRDIREIGLGIGNAIAFANDFVITEDKIWPYHTFKHSYEYFRKCILSQ
jgi:dephospho-CoA kinase